MKKKKEFSRRRRALRYVVRAVIVLLLVNHFLMVGLLFPVQALRRFEERAGTGRTAVVLRDWAPEVHWSQLVYLTESENVTMLSGAQLTWLGWTDAFGMPLDCSEEAPLYGGWWSMSRKGRSSLFYVFGRIDAPDIDFLEVFVLNREDPLEEEKIGRVSGSWGIGRESFAEKDGRSYFLLETRKDWSDYPSGFRVVAVGYDEKRTEMFRQELDQGASSHFG